MSFSLYWKPKPIPSQGQVFSSYDLKWYFVRRFCDHDGSLKEGPFEWTKQDTHWLVGLIDGLDDTLTIKRQAQCLLDCIQKNPQGVNIWIGDGNEF